MGEFLIFDLFGAMSSWGDIAVGDFRETATHPSRSAVLGMLASALGLPRTDYVELERLEQDFRFAVRVETPGLLLRDYHTVQAPTGKRARDLPTRKDELEYDKVGATLTYRGYRAGGLYLAIIERKSGEVDEWRRALERPSWVPFLGRKSCPTALPLNPRIAAGSNVLDIARREPAVEPFDDASANARFRTQLGVGEEADLYWEGDLHGEDDVDTNFRNDQLTSAQHRQFRRRAEHHKRVRRPVSKEER